MIKITKQERDFLVNEKNVTCGENGVSKTHSHSKSYFLCESFNNIKLLNEYRKSKIVK